MSSTHLGWMGIVRLGLVQTALGSIVVLNTSTINRVMVIELVLPAVLPGALVALHYALQVLRPGWGHGSDLGGRKTTWIMFGMVVLALGGIGSSVSVALFEVNYWFGLAAAVLAFLLVGIGVGAAGTSLLTLLATSVAPERRGAAATIVWMMMIFGFIVTTIIAGHYLDPFSSVRLVAICSVISVIAVALSMMALWGLEKEPDPIGSGATQRSRSRDSRPFAVALAAVWDDDRARTFTIFIFISMLAYSMQELILEPFAGIVYGLSVGQTTKLSGVQHAGVFAGMLLVALATHPRINIGTLRGWTIAGCYASAIAILGPALVGVVDDVLPLRPIVFILGIANGAFAVAAIGSMMGLSASAGHGREGIRMGLWGAAQAIAFGIGGLTGAALVDLAKFAVASPYAYSLTFVAEAVLFVVAASIAQRAIPKTVAQKPPREQGEALYVPKLAEAQ